MLIESFIWSYRFLHCRNRNILRSTNPLVLHSEFPRNFLVSIVLVVFSLILLLLFSQVITTLFSTSFNGTTGVKTPSIAYLVAYILANSLFACHLCLYFGYKEHLTIGEEEVFLKRGLFGLSHTKVINLGSIFYHQSTQSVLGNYHLRIIYHDEAGKTKSIRFGSYLDDEYLELLTAYFDRMYSLRIATETDHQI